MRTEALKRRVRRDGRSRSAHTQILLGGAGAAASFSGKEVSRALSHCSVPGYILLISSQISWIKNHLEKLMVISIQLLFMHVPEIENTSSLLLYGKKFLKNHQVEYVSRHNDSPRRRLSILYFYAKSQESLLKEVMLDSVLKDGN